MQSQKSNQIHIKGPQGMDVAPGVCLLSNNISTKYNPDSLLLSIADLPACIVHFQYEMIMRVSLCSAEEDNE